jgi:signal transduction histidine kinase
VDAQDSRRDGRALLTWEETVSLPLLEPLFARNRALILETLSLHLGSDPEEASVLSGDLTVARLKQAQQEYLFSLTNGNNEESAGRNSAPAAADRETFGLGAEWHLRTFAHLLTSIQPLVFEVFGSRPHVHHRVWSALLKVIFRDLELAMSASLKQRDSLVEAARRDVNEMKRALDLVLNKQAADERQRQAERRTLTSLLAAWRTKMSGSAQEMGTPLNVILGRAESLLEQTQEGKPRAALQSIVRQVERLIMLREELCFLDRGLGCEFHASDPTAMAEGLSGSYQELGGESGAGPR